MQTPAQPPASRPQIVTLTMNPALDITTNVDVVRPTDKLRCAATRYDPGGGGINVAHIAHVLGGSVLAVFPAGGDDRWSDRAAAQRRGCAVLASSDRGGNARELHGQREHQRPAVPVRPSGAAADVARAGALPRAIANGGEVSRIRGGERQPAAGRNRRLLSAGRRHVPAAGHPPYPGHLRRRLAARLLRGVPSQIERARTAGMRRTPPGHRSRAIRSRP